MTPALPFTAADAERAHQTWGANCGPTALAAVLSLRLEDVRPAIPGFEARRFTNPTMMRHALLVLRRRWRELPEDMWPRCGLVRVQWEGPWTEPGAPLVAAYRHSHWIGASGQPGAVQIFDVNALDAGGWIPLRVWSDQLVPWLLRQCEPKASGGWHTTHRWEVLS